MNVKEGRSPQQTRADVSAKRNKGFALDAREGMTSVELETFLRDLYDFHILEGIYGAPVADKLLELEEKISFLRLGNEATA